MNDRTDGPDHRAETPNRWITNPATRRGIYGAALVLGAVLIVVGVVTEDQVNFVLEYVGLALALSPTALALVNTPKGR